MEEQRDYYLTGATAKLDHRRQQLSSLKKLLVEESDVLTEAVWKDLKRVSKLWKLVEGILGL